MPVSPVLAALGGALVGAITSHFLAERRRRTEAVERNAEKDLEKFEEASLDLFEALLQMRARCSDPDADSDASLQQVLEDYARALSAWRVTLEESGVPVTQEIGAALIAAAYAGEFADAARYPIDRSHFRPFNAVWDELVRLSPRVRRTVAKRVLSKDRD